MENNRIKRYSRRIGEGAFIWALGGTCYYFLEIALRGYSHWSMFVLGGAVLCFATFQGVLMQWSEPLWMQAGRGVVLVTALEFITGLIVNKWLNLGIWDYSDQPFQLWGQICLPFAILFCGRGLSGRLPFPRAVSGGKTSFFYPLDIPGHRRT